MGCGCDSKGGSCEGEIRRNEKKCYECGMNIEAGEEVIMDEVTYCKRCAKKMRG